MHPKIQYSLGNFVKYIPHLYLFMLREYLYVFHIFITLFSSNKSSNCLQVSIQMVNFSKNTEPKNRRSL